MEAGSTLMQGKTEGMGSRDSALLTVSHRHGLSVLPGGLRLVLRRIRGLVMDMWEDYGSSCSLSKIRPHFKVYLPFQQPWSVPVDLKKNLTRESTTDQYD